MTGQQVNVPLLRKAVEWAEAEAAKPGGGLWNQRNWIRPTACGTAYCIAGYVGQLIDARYTDDGYGGGGPHVSVVAAEALGIPYSELGPVADVPLFRSDNTIEDIRRIAEDLVGERL